MTAATCKDWSADDPAAVPLIVANIQALWPDIEAAASSRPPPTLDLILEWHRRIYAGVAVPEAQYVGQVRDSDERFPCLIGYEVSVGGVAGTPAREVPDALGRLIGAATAVTGALDAAIPPGTVPSRHLDVAAIVRLCANAHGEWIRIHPFANGNGRTARILANWLAVRYGLPPFVRIKPRPDDFLFAGAAALSMRGQHHATEALFISLLGQALVEASGEG
ncbi:MAG: Fic family protein [Chloroflexi bacterium]|nr:Fic family protein [Chloroflexota bacterium]